VVRNAGHLAFVTQTRVGGRYRGIVEALRTRFPGLKGRR